MNDRSSASIASWLWRVPAITAAYVAGSNVSGWAVAHLGLQTPRFPGQEREPALALLAAIVLATGLALLARGLRGSTTVRWSALFAFTYVAFCVNNQIEGAVFTTADGFAANLVFFILPCAVLVGAAVLLVPPPDGDGHVATVFSTTTAAAWWWRPLLAWLAFPLIYYFFGMFAYPLVADAYQSGDFGLEVPSQRLILGAVSLRSLLFLLAAIPILALWARSRRALVLSLGAALAAMVGVVAMIEGSWLPATVRLVHGVEITVDSLVHAWVVVALLVPRRPAGRREPPGLSAEPTS